MLAVLTCYNFNHYLPRADHLASRSQLAAVSYWEHSPHLSLWISGSTLRLTHCYAIQMSLSFCFKRNLHFSVRNHVLTGTPPVPGRWQNTSVDLAYWHTCGTIFPICKALVAVGNVIVAPLLYCSSGIKAFQKVREELSVSGWNRTPQKLLTSWKLATLLNNAYLLEEITECSELWEVSGASSCVVSDCHSGAEQAVKPLGSRDRDMIKRTQI